jgi:hypothetical protein
VARKKYIYEVRISVPAQKAGDFRVWILEHIDEMVRLPYFSNAKLFAGDSLETADVAVFNVHYELTAKHSLQEYLQKSAAQMREKLPQQFAGELHFSRALVCETSDCR